jgi:hypothetical protein
MRSVTPLSYLRKSSQHLSLLLVDNIMLVIAFLIVGLSSLVVHKSVERLQLWGVSSMLVQGMKFLHTYMWLVDALGVAWLSSTATFRFCQRATKE